MGLTPQGSFSPSSVFLFLDVLVVSLISCFSCFRSISPPTWRLRCAHLKCSFHSSGVAAHHLAKVPSPIFLRMADSLQAHALALRAGFVVDFSFMFNLDVRDGFERFGATAYFDAEGAPLGIYWCAKGGLVFPGQGKEWEHAKFVWRSSVVTGVTAVDHLVGLHMTVSSFIIVSSRENLPAVHPLRRLLKPFSFRTYVINRAAMTHLLSQHSLLHRTTAFTWDGLLGAFRHAFHTNRWQSLGQRMRAQNMRYAACATPKSHVGVC